MGWMNCGSDSQGRPIGYGFEATCDHPGCKKEIHRGLSYACGGMHGEDEISCEKYFCEEHSQNWVEHCGQYHQVCDECAKELLETEEWRVDEEEGVLKYAADFVDSPIEDSEVG
jgi:hypothetical protein